MQLNSEITEQKPHKWSEETWTRMIRMQIQRRDYWIVLLPTELSLLMSSHAWQTCYYPPTAVVSSACLSSPHGMQHQKNMESGREKRGSAKRKPVRPEFLKVNCNYQLIWLPALEAGGHRSKESAEQKTHRNKIPRRKCKLSFQYHLLMVRLSQPLLLLILWVVKRTRITLR